ncbi:MAG: DNA cytosine methyltransferase [Candidatus Nomurabacteria bacterium]|jgi:DNA (cytosine-5)-methyltransferase 1|nr:DNA cytosine methyltransferase [Candidatus Nomurabacteria bacterium]
MKHLTITSLFTGCGGLDLGFERAGFRTVWANEFDRNIWETFERNFLHTHLNKQDLRHIKPEDIPDTDGIIGGPPCQSWSSAGAKRGLKDQRGQLFYNYIEMIRAKQPKFFLCENVAGLVTIRNRKAFADFIRLFEDAGYNVSWKLLDTSDYGVPQTRKRVIIIGYRKDLDKEFVFPKPMTEKKLTLRDAIGNLPLATPATEHNHANIGLKIPNHEYFMGKFSSRFFQANRMRKWNEPSYTIVAMANSVPLHPSSPPMVKLGSMDFTLAPNRETEYRRLSVRECARVQTFPDDFIFHYKNVVDGYKMIGNAVPPKLAEVIAKQIYNDLSQAK